MDKIKNLLDEIERFGDNYLIQYKGSIIKKYVSSLRPLVEDLHSRLKLWECRADELRKDCDRLYADRNNWMKQALAEDERANATQPVTNCNGFKGRLALEQIRAALLLDSGCGPTTALHLAVDKFTQEALAEPPRNCDLLRNSQEALVAIHNDRGYVNNPIDERRLAVDWLFAEAKGRDNGND